MINEKIRHSHVFPPLGLHQLSYTPPSAASSHMPPLSSSPLSCDLLPKMLPEKQEEAEQRHTQHYEQSTGPPPGRALASTLPGLSLQTPPGHSSNETFST